MKYNDLTYDEFIALVSVVVFEDIKVLEKENEHLKRRILGYKSTIEHLNEKLYKRNEGFRGDVYDKDIRKKTR